MHTVQTNETNPTNPNPNPRSRTQLQIACLQMVMDDIDQTDDWGSRLYQVLDCYHSSLWMQHSKIPAYRSDREKMIAAVHELDLCFHSLMEEPEAEGWYFGINTADNLGFGLANLLVTVRNELLIAIAIRH